MNAQLETRADEIYLHLIHHGGFDGLIDPMICDDRIRRLVGLAFEHGWGVGFAIAKAQYEVPKTPARKKRK